MTALAPPALRIVTKYTQNSGSIDRSVRACLLGGMASVVRFGDINSEDGLLGLYNETPSIVAGIAQTLYPWPSLPAGNVVEQSAAKLWVKNGLWRYFADFDTDALVGADRSSIIAEAGVRFGTNASGTSTIIDGGVAVGDYVRLVAAKTGGGTETLVTKVVGFGRAAVASSVGSPTISPTAFPNQSAASSIATQPGVGIGMATTTNHTNYNGLNSFPNETYTLTVLVGGTPGTAIVSVKSGSGTDDIESVTTGAEDTFFNVGTRGFQVKFTTASGISALVVGQKYVYSVSDLVSARTLDVTGTYTGTSNRTYIVEVVRGGFLSSNTVQVRVRSSDGTDQLAPVTLTEASAGVSVSFPVGSYGLSGVLTATNGLVVGDKFSIACTAAGLGAITTLQLSDSFSSLVPVNSLSVNMTYEFFRVRTEEIPASIDNTVLFSTEATQLSVRGAISLTFSDITSSGVPVSCPLYGLSELPSLSQLYVSYRSWYPAFTAPIQVTATADLSIVLDGPSDVDNVLRKGVEVARLTAASDSLYVMAVGDPDNIDHWESALAAVGRDMDMYQIVPLSDNPLVQSVVAGFIAASNGATSPSNRVGWLASAKVAGKSMLDATLTTNLQHALAVVEDDPAASGTQYTRVRITSGNANVQTLGVRVGDQIRYEFDVDQRGKTTYTTRTITQILSGTSVIIDTALPENGVAKRVEIFRVFKAADLVAHYSSDAGTWGSRDIRYVLAPEIVVGGKVLPGYFGAAMVAGLRTALLPHQPLSTVAVSGIQSVRGLEQLGYNDLNELAGAGCMILAYDNLQSAVTVRHGVTTGETDILAIREESMVTATHVALRMVRSTLRPLVAQVLIDSGTDSTRLEELVRSTMDSIRGELMSAWYTPQLGGLISDLIIDFVGPSSNQSDELVVRGRMFFGTVANVVTFEHSVN